MLADPEIDAIVVSTPSFTHEELVGAALSANKHVLVEKPFVLDPRGGERLVELARNVGKVLLVGHVYEYNPAVEYIRELLSGKSLGETYYIQSTRTNLGPIRSDVNALWDLAPHDVSILLYLLGTVPTSVSAKGADFFNNGRHDVVFATLTFPRGILGHLHVSWLDPRKTREITVVGAARMLVFDDLNQLEPVRIYDRGLSEVPSYQTFGEFQLVPRFGDITIPRVSMVEPLRAQCAHFLSCVEGTAQPRSDGEDGLRVVRVLSALQRSLESDGATVAVE
jgi:predicted dehydrogenase